MDFFLFYFWTISVKLQEKNKSDDELHEQSTKNLTIFMVIALAGKSEQGPWKNGK